MPLLDGVTLIATPKFTFMSRGSSSAHPKAIDFGFNGTENMNQPLYSGIYGAKEVKVARKRYTQGGIGSGSTGHVIDIQFETENYTCFRSSMHMSEASHLSVGTPLKWNDIIGYMGSTGDSTGPHDHVILAICPKGTPVEQMYDYRVEPDPYYHFAEDWTVTQYPDDLPWVKLGEEPEPPSSSEKEKLVVIIEDTEGMKGHFEMSDTYKVIEQSGKKVVLEKVDTPKVNEYGQAVFAGSNIEFSYIYSTPNGHEPSGEPYHKNAKGRGYGKVKRVIGGKAFAPYEIELNGSVIGYVKPVNTY